MSVLIYSGGFAPIGGIETFLFDLTLHLHRRNVAVSICCWGARNALLDRLKHEGVAITRLPFRWGCRWDWPDRMLFALTREDVQRADVVVLGKLFRGGGTNRLLSLRNPKLGPRFFYMTPYRPREQWGSSDSMKGLLNSIDVIATQTTTFAQDLVDYGYTGPIELLPYPPPGVYAANPLPIALRSGLAF